MAGTRRPNYSSFNAVVLRGPPLKFVVMVPRALAKTLRRHQMKASERKLETSAMSATVEIVLSAQMPIYTGRRSCVGHTSPDDFELQPTGSFWTVHETRARS